MLIAVTVIVMAVAPAVSSAAAVIVMVMAPAVSSAATVIVMVVAPVSFFMSVFMTASTPACIPAFTSSHIKFKQTAINITACLLETASKQSRGASKILIRIILRNVRFPDSIKSYISHSYHLLSVLTIYGIKKPEFCYSKSTNPVKKQRALVNNLHILSV
jgi:hypothetical protein